MIRRTMNSEAVNVIANHPTIRPYVGGGTEPLDLTSVVLNPANYVLEADGGCWVLQALGPGSYEVHTLFLPDGRGKGFSRQVKEAIRWMFVRTDAVEILTKCPDDNPGARMAAIMCGFKECFRREGAWAPDVGISYQILTLDDWAFRDKECLSAGIAFHEILEAAKPASGSELPPHPEDEAHDRAAGAAYLIIQHGNIDKGVNWYNRWAIFAGYPPVSYIGLNVFDLGEGVLAQILDGKMDVLRTR